MRCVKKAIGMDWLNNLPDGERVLLGLALLALMLLIITVFICIPYLIFYIYLYIKRNNYIEGSEKFIEFIESIIRFGGKDPEDILNYSGSKVSKTDIKKEQIINLSHDLELSKLELEKTKIETQINNLKNPEDALMKLRNELTEKIRKKEIFQEYELEKMALTIKQTLKTKQEKRRLRQEAINVLLQGRNYNDLNNAERKELDDLEDMLESLFDEA